MDSRGDINATPESPKGKCPDEIDASLRLLIRYVYSDKPTSQLPVEKKLENVGIKTSCALIASLFTQKTYDTLNAILMRAREKAFTTETLLAMRRCVLLEPGFFKDFLHWAVPNWQARELESVQEKFSFLKVHNVQSMHSVLTRDGGYINTRLAVLYATGFRLCTIKTLIERAKRVMSLCYQTKSVDLHTLGGRLLVTLCVQDFTTGADVMEAAKRYLEPGVLIKDIIIEDRRIRRSQTIGELNVKTGTSLQLVFGDKGRGIPRQRKTREQPSGVSD